MRTVFDAVGGLEGLTDLARAWHRRVVADEVVGHAFRQGFRPDHVERLAAYWAEALGGPRGYSAAYGDESSVVALHSGNGDLTEMNERALLCFDGALAEIGIDPGGELFTTLHRYFAWAEAAMARYPDSAGDVPAGMAIPRWSWDGPLDEGRP